jgi:hypothetical protein
MAACCGDSPVNLHGDCDLWCNVDLPPYVPGLPSLNQAISRFSSCLRQDQGPTYFPDLQCRNGTEAAAPAEPSSGTQPAGVMPTGTTSTDPEVPTFTGPSGTASSQPTASPTPTDQPGAGSRSSGTGTKLAAGLVIFQIVLGVAM